MIQPNFRIAYIYLPIPALEPNGVQTDQTLYRLSPLAAMHLLPQVAVLAFAFASLLATMTCSMPIEHGDTLALLEGNQHPMPNAQVTCGFFHKKLPSLTGNCSPSRASSTGHTASGVVRNTSSSLAWTLRAVEAAKIFQLHHWWSTRTTLPLEAGP